MRRTRLLSRSLIAIGAVSSLYLASWHFARGGIHYFSPHTLETHAQSEILLPFTEIPIYRSGTETYRYPLVQYLMDKDYWSATNFEAPPMLTSRWNQQWRDGQTDIHRQFAWNAEPWIEWTDKHPDIAATFWPSVLQFLRSDTEYSQSYVSQIMLLARASETVAHFDQFVADDPNLAAEIVGMTKP